MSFKSASPTAPIFGSYIMFPSPLAGYSLANSGMDWVLIDMEHSPLSASKMTALVHAVNVGSRNKTLSFVRIPSHGVEYVKWALDSGANGIIAPMVESRAQAESIVAHGRYPPTGSRSFGPFLAPPTRLSGDGWSLGGYFSKASESISLIVMIESVKGVENAEEIMSVPGLSGIFIGPVDLRLSMGLSGSHGEEEQYLAALDKIGSLGKKRPGLQIGIFAADPGLFPLLQSRGFSFFLIGGDVMYVEKAAKESLKVAKDACCSPGGASNL